MLAYDFPILGLFWSVLIFSIWIAWLILLFHVFTDVFRSDMRGVSKGLWAIIVIAFPFLGVFVYVLANGDAMSKRNIARAQQSQQAFDSYVRSAVGSGGPASELAQLADLHKSGALTDAEFASQKAKVLAG